MKRILLVNTNTEKAPYPVPPLGLCLLASELESRYEVKVYDGVFDEGEKLVDLVLAFRPDFIGFSIRNIDDIVMDRALFYIGPIISDFIEPVRKITSVPVILGGSGFSIFPVELMKMTGADFGIIGESEDLFPELLDCIERGKDISGIPNLITSAALKVQRGSGSRLLDSSQLKFAEIDRHIDFTPYLQKGVYSIQTKRGCSHGCIYCTYPVIEGRHFRTRKPSEIADEIEQASKRLGSVTFEFVDSTFNDPAGHAEAICREIIKKRIRIRLRTMGINPGHTSEELFELMMEAGFAQIDVTPDSASPKILQNLDKGFDLSGIEKMALLIKKFDLPAMWFFLFGGPGEDEKTVRETFDFIDAYVNPEDMVYMTTGLRIYPGTPLFNIALKEGKIRKGQSILYPSVFYFSDQLGKEGVEKLVREASLTRPHCIPAMETTPSQEMIHEANELRNNLNLTEPMFRTLLRVRKKWISERKI